MYRGDIREFYAFYEPTKYSVNMPSVQIKTKERSRRKDKD